MIKFSTFLENKITQKDDFLKLDNSWHYLQNVVKSLTHKQKVEFALYCVKDSLQYTNKEMQPLVEKRIQLIEKWLQDPKSVTQQELRNIAAWVSISDVVSSNAANAAANAAAWATTSDVFSPNAAVYKEKMQQYIQVAKQLHPEIEKSNSDAHKVQEIIQKIKQSEDSADLSVTLDELEELVPLEGLHAYFHVKNNAQLAEFLIDKKFLIINILNKL